MTPVGPLQERDFLELHEIGQCEFNCTYCADEDYEPEHDDSVKCCPDCERPNQFGELCVECEREVQIGIAEGRIA